MRALRKLWRTPDLVAGALVVLAFLAVAILAPVLEPPPYPNDPYRMAPKSFRVEPTPPNAEHPLGTLPRQYDILYGLVWGTRVAFRTGLLVALSRALIGVLVGLAAGSAGGWLDSLLMRVTDAFLAFPIMAAVLLMLGLFSNYVTRVAGQATVLVMASLVVFGWMPYARLIRGNVLAEQGKQYVEAAVATGAPRRRLILRHLLPNSTSGLYTLIAADIGGVVVLVAVFAFLGFMGGEMTADWGKMMSASRDWIVSSRARPFATWYVYAPVSLAVVLFSTGWNLLGEGLRQVLDPRMR